MDFQILGPFRVTDDAGRELALGGDKPAALLAMLALRPRELVQAERLIEDLWDGQPPATAAKTLQVHVSRLRRVLPQGTIATTSGGYLLEAAREQVDAFRFEALVQDGRAAHSEGAHARASARLRAALALWRGDALADFAYASFAQDAIARLDGLRLVALESAVEAELELGRHAELIPELKALVKRHPLSEHLRAQLMLALYRSGRQAEALGVYRAARRILVDQLGLEPSEELRELERAILAQDKALAPPAVGSRPPRERPDKPSRGALVGYEQELGSLEDVLEQALAGQGGLALVAGEPGVGKTRLADELSSVAVARGAQVIWGRARSGGGAPAYWPWTQVLRALAGERDAATLRAETGTGAAELMQLLPELRDQLPDVAPADRLDAEDARFRLFDAVALFLARAAAARPLVIVLDDLHAADRSTLALLEFVAPTALEAHILILGTYRDTDADLEQPLRDALNELARTTDCLQLVLTGMSGEDTAHFVELSAGVAPMPRLAAAIHETSSGNPLFVSELVRLLRAENRLDELDGGGSLVLPRGVEQVIARRVERLSEPCRQTLALSAVIGREFDLTLLERAGDAAGDELLAQIDDAIAARVLELASGSSFRFSHDLVRQTLYSSLGPVEQRRMHQAVGTALEQLHAARPEPVVAALAEHFAAALPSGDPAKAARYLALAGDSAAEVPAAHEAAAYYRRAAEVGRAHGADAAQLCDLYLRVAEQLVAIPDMQSASAAIDEADALMPAAPDREREARLAIARAHMRLLDALALDDASVFDAIEMFQQLGDPGAEARGWEALVTLNCGRSDRLKGGEAAERMLDCARRSGSRALIGRAMRSIGSNFALGSAPLDEAVPRLRALIADAGDGTTKARLMNCLARLEAFRGRFDEARVLVAEAREVCPPAERANLEPYLLGGSANTEFLAGNLHRAVDLARDNWAELEATGLQRYLSSEGCVLVDALIGLGQLEDAAAKLEQVPPAAADDADALMRQARSRSRLALARRNLDAAEMLAREALGHVEAANAIDEHAECLLLLADIQVATGDDDGARSSAAQALALAEQRGHLVFAQQARELLAAPAPAVA